MSVFKRSGSPYYYAEFEIDGNRICRSTKAKTEREARAVEKRLREQVRERLKNNKVEDGSLTLDKAFGTYWIQQSHKLAPSWAAEVQRYLAEILRLSPQGLCIEAMTDADVNEYVQARLMEGAGPYAINRALAVWRRVHNVARKTWKLKVQVIDWAEYMNDEKKRVSFFTIDQVCRLVKAAHPEIGLAIEWSVHTGCRLEETFGLTWGKVFFDRGCAEVIAKGGKQHTVWLSPQALAVLGQCNRERRYVFDDIGRRSRWEAALKACGLSGVHRWHDLRHTHATWLRQAGAPIEVVQRSLGHADVHTTMRYAHVADRELQTALHQLPTISTNIGNVASIFVAKSGS